MGGERLIECEQLSPFAMSKVKEVGEVKEGERSKEVGLGMSADVRQYAILKWAYHDVAELELLPLLVFSLMID